MVTTENSATEVHDARSRLVMSALRLFAEKGYKAASTREICDTAGANISAIRYYFGDKQGLYRAAFTEPMGDLPCGSNVAEYADLPLPEVLGRFFSEFLEPFKRGEELGLVMKLHFREMIEPTGAWQQEIDAEIKPQHAALVSLLKAHLGLSDTDADVHRLAFAMIGMAVYFYVGQEIVSAISPPILTTPKAIDVLAERLAGYALAMIEGEVARRAQDSTNEQ
ncbi:Transcriptional regulator, AcrR family [Methylomonas albis]|uniref:CerR family C-terminal domain-containing protein n=1 Tax=Methylomonas albis TaxID=1854563 RepID=A0ABR9D504_9GAMM|nr:CerR family C-terminal domain-containing protein [Methylomonas albis]MBD9357876.1 CerR family C-terminal domain-containing protein [Methylomonas albis]CAD6881209.1 Transcriptional regulator, AcrR family [Methylomonas albis]